MEYTKSDEQWAMSSGQRAMRDAGGFRVRRCRAARAGTKKKGPLEDLPQGARESSGDLLSRARGPGTIGDEGLDFRVRKGNGYDPLSITAETILSATTCCRKSPELAQP